MVVLEGGGMLSTGANQYLQPDYLSPLPTTLDAKKSPLALLAQTCSQIGADTPSKPLLDKPSKKSSNPRPASSERPQQSPPKRASPTASAATSPAGLGGAPSPRNSSSPSSPPSSQPTKLAFKPYEANVLSRRDDRNDRPPSKSGSEADDRKSTASTPSTKKSSSPNPAARPGSSPAPKAASPPSQSPVIRSGLEVLQGHPKDLPLGTFKPGMLTSAQIAQLCCPPGYDPAAHAAHPAFRPPFAGSPFSQQQQHAAALLAGVGVGYHSNPYITYQRVKTPGGGETVVPICKDPYCNGCQFTMHNALMQLGVPCPAGCTQCEHQKYLSLPGLAAAAAGYSRPYVCNWIAGEAYCGKRFGSSDELLQHLRSHTSAPSAASPGGSSPSVTSVPGALPSPSSYARYHPYAKPGAGLLPPASHASPFSAFNPAGLAGGLAGLGAVPGLSAGLSAGLSPYYSPYALYGQRMGAAVHP